VAEKPGQISDPANRTVEELITESPEETEDLGFRLGRELPVPGIVLLRGALGTGKTTLARGIARGLGLKDGSLVNSPSFTLVNVYQGKCPIYHVDLYRLEGKRAHYSIGLEEFLAGNGVTIVEWSEKLLLPVGPAILVELRDAGEQSREIRISRIMGPEGSLHGSRSKKTTAPGRRGQVRHSKQEELN
jgi:tRNA threonylcarbamoyladenosine biosynthesis protein TsaE